MDHYKKLAELFGVTEVKGYKEPANPAELLEMGRYYSDLYARVSARGTEHVDRVFDEIARVLGGVLQPLAREKYGVADAHAVKRLLDGVWGKPAEEAWQRYKSLVRETVVGRGLSEDVEGALLKLADEFPDMMRECWANLAGKMKLIPVESVSEVTLALAEMLKEDEKHADKRTGS